MEAPVAETQAPPPSDRVRLRRYRNRGSYEREQIDAILDEALVAHLGIVDADGQPFVLPTMHARLGDIVYCHGSAAGRTLKVLGSGAGVCLTVTLLDGIVFARAVANHGANYRAVVILGEGRLVTDRDEKLRALEAVVEHITPGRWLEARRPTENELRETSVVALGLEEASAKMRSGPPGDDDADYALDVWAGVVPVHEAFGAPQGCPRLASGIAVPPGVADYSRAPRPRT
jgi:nitroimidazol reductase NimA-like FMN-containing flavoprotein (pyridoxamine 5'-phosphate oxidase superfamily)